MITTSDSPPLTLRIMRALKKRWGSAEAKQRVWNSEYSLGQWDCIQLLSDTKPRDPIYAYLARYAEGGSILDLGCGDGMTAREMEPNFRGYLGVDVSDVAIERARLDLRRATDRADKVQFAVGDIVTFEPPGLYSVILFRESIYYVPLHQARNMLARCRSLLTANGTVMVRLCDRHRYRKIIDLLHQEFSVTDSYCPADSPLAILVCSPRERS